MASKKKKKTTDKETTEEPAQGSAAEAGRPPRELSREELERLRERLHKKFH
jgi:hypothetical protein